MVILSALPQPLTHEMILSPCLRALCRVGMLQGKSNDGYRRCIRVFIVSSHSWGRNGENDIFAISEKTMKRPNNGLMFAARQVCDK